MDYTGLYDIERINGLLDEYYGTQDDPSQDEPSQGESSQDESSQAESSQQASAIESGTETFSTGDSTTAWIVVLIMLLSAGTVFVALRKKEKSE